MFRFSSIRHFSNAIFISPYVQSQSSTKTTPLSGVKILAMHDSAIVHLVLRSLRDFGAEIIDAPLAMYRKVTDDESQIQRDILMNTCRKIDLLIEGLPAGTLKQNDLNLEHFMKNHSMMVTARFTDNLCSSPQTKLYTFQDAFALTAHLRALTTGAISSIIMALYDAQRHGYGTVLDIDTKYLSQQFPHLYDHEGTFRRFYKTSDGKWLFVGVCDPCSLSLLFKKLDLLVDINAPDNRISAVLAKKLQEQTQKFWTDQLSDLQVVGI